MSQIQILAAVLFCGLATYRLSQLFVVDKIFKPLRKRLGVYDCDSSGEPKTFLGRLFSCPFCVGVWIALFASVWLMRGFDLVVWLAIAGVQCFLETSFGRIEMGNG